MKEPFLINLKNYNDNRGSFAEKHNIQIQNRLNIIWRQENFSISKKNVIRGLHYQLKFPQAKLIHCINGKILDVIVDIRSKSSNYGKYFKYLLKYDQMLFIPEGFAHGFLSLEDNTIVEYKCSDYYVPNDQHFIVWNDKTLNIEWGINNPILSEKDINSLTFENSRKFM